MNREGWLLRTSRDISSENDSITSKATTPSMLRLTRRLQFLAVFKARTCQSRLNRFSTRNKNLQIAGPMRISISSVDATTVHLICHCTLTTASALTDTRKTKSTFPPWCRRPVFATVPHVDVVTHWRKFFTPWSSRGCHLSETARLVLYPICRLDLRWLSNKVTASIHRSRFFDRKVFSFVEFDFGCGIGVAALASSFHVCKHVLSRAPHELQPLESLYARHLHLLCAAREQAIPDGRPYVWAVCIDFRFLRHACTVAPSLSSNRSCVCGSVICTISSGISRNRLQRWVSQRRTTMRGD